MEKNVLLHGRQRGFGPAGFSFFALAGQTLGQRS
ncbi:hypothetical protein IJ22_00890 [Paenibacillus naphthalenovorans]|uniref:Uncharacterized protein n=1 Tax=Paenibacillus naphthalenovorans TaxID=162209 RepID=A0A0U2UEZ6_9BACL|nr:hypothetical protein IJ22_00890 [Paenibacillus naphthalenovorans]